MTIDTKDFFLEATRRICGSLDIEKAMWNCLLYIRDYLPADILLVCDYDRNLGIANIIAIADEQGGKITSIPLTASDDVRNFIENILEDSEAKDASLVLKTDRGADHPICSYISELIGDPDCAFLFIGPRPGAASQGIFLGCRSGKKYTEEHVQLFTLLGEPFAIALSNNLRYREVSRLKDILADDNRYLYEELSKQAGDEIVGANLGLRHVMELVRQVAPLSSPVLILGETGVGKEVIARAIHNLSPRRNGPMIKVNCGAIPESLMDSELFGHEKGAFTGALYQKRGRFERAHGGTIFLDEIGELTPGVQIRLLRVLQEKEIERVGGGSPIPVDIRVIAATHRNLETMLAHGKFREDLYFRLQVFPIFIPPLRERRTDIPSLVQHFIKRKSREMGLAVIPDLAPGSIEKLLNYNWPGNVREVQNIVERALIVSKNTPMVFDNLGETSHQITEFQTEIVDGDSFAIDQNLTQLIERALFATGGRIGGEKGAAKLLRIKPTTLRAKMTKLGIPFGRKTLKTNHGNLNQDRS